MASIIREIAINASPDHVWSVIGNFTTGPQRMAPGYVIDNRMDGTTDRIVTFANGNIARERLIAVDDHARRIVWAWIGDAVRPAHNNSSMQVYAEQGASRLVWAHDVLPDETRPRPRSCHGRRPAHHQTDPGDSMNTTEFEAHQQIVTTRSGETAAVDIGQGPVALFVHGAGTNFHLWRNIIGELAGERRCIDLPGHGRTPPRPGLLTRSARRPLGGPLPIPRPDRP